MASLFLNPLRSPIVRLVPKSTGVQVSLRRYISSSTRPTYPCRFPRNSNTTTTRSYSTVVVQDRPRGRTRRIFTTVLLSLGSFLVGGYFALSYAPPFLTPLIMGSMPTDDDTLRFDAPDEFTREIDEHIRNSEIAQMLRKDPNFIESRPHLKIPDEVRQHNLTAGTLMGPDMIVVPPLCFNQKDGESMVCIFYVGTHLSGHPGIVHGGFLATMLDEGLARCAFPAMPNKVGVTAQLNISYKKPTMAGQFLILACQTDKVEGRKAWAHGSVFPLEEVTCADGNFHTKDPLVSADALFIEPRHAKILKSLYRQAT